MNLAKRNDGAWIPATDEDKVKADRHKTGTIAKCSVPNQRNAQFHRKFFALLNLAWENLPEKYEFNFPRSETMPDEVREEIIKRAGYFTSWTNFKGATEYKAKSIAFTNMGQNEFEQLYSACIDVIVKYLELPKDVIESELIGFF